MNKVDKDTDVEKQSSTPRLPLEVPSSMRTRRSGPRIIAGVITVAWLFIFVMGTHALSQKNRAPGSPLDQFLTEGEKFWIAKSSDGKKICEAHFRSNFKLEGPKNNVKGSLKTHRQPRFNIEASFLVSFFGKPTLSKLNLLSEFDKFLTLKSFNSTLSVGKRLVNLQTIEGDKKLISMNVETGVKTVTRTLPRPTPIYLINKFGKAYTIKFPKQLDGVFSMLPVSNSESSNLLTPVDEKQFVRCKNSLVELSAEGEPTNKDFESYLEKFQLTSVQ